MPAPVADTIVLGGLNSLEGKVVSVPNHQAINEKASVSVDNAEVNKDGPLVLDSEIKGGHPLSSDSDSDQDSADVNQDAIIITGSDAAKHLLSLRDDREPAFTFRSIFLATILSAFQAVMSQIYQVS